MYAVVGQRMNLVPKRVILASLRPLVSVRTYSPRVRRAPIRRANLAEEPYNSHILGSMAQIVDEPLIAIERQLEIGSILLGFEQGRIFRLHRTDGSMLGHMEEVDLGIGRAITRQITRLHRPFTVRVFDFKGNHTLTIRRPFSFINSHIQCFLPAVINQSETSSDLLIGESRQEWHPWRRRYNLFVKNNNASMDQFGRVDTPFLSFQFPVADEQNQIIGSVDRNWTGIGRELFTDTGVYFLRFSPECVHETLNNPNDQVSRRSLTLAERTVMMATAISIDFDYFSRHSNRGPMMFPFFGDEV